MDSYIWLGTGVVLTAASRIFMRYSDKTAFYTLFMWIGVIFFMYGVLKLLFASNKDKPPSTPKDLILTNCEKCNSKNHSISNFCHVCGHELKKALFK